MTRYKPGDVVLVDVMFSNGSGVKKRPALVISSNKYHESRQEVIIAAITSNIRRILCGDSEVKKWKEAGLLFPSVVTGIIQTITAGMIDRKLGVLSETDLQNTRKNLNKALKI